MAESPPDANPAPVDEAAVRRQLARILASPEFSSSQRLSAFLDFVTGHALTNRADELKEYLIAVEVYGHKPDYDPQAKSTVRVEASRLRNRLREYYEKTGRNDPVRIEIPKGSYVPVFHSIQPAEVPTIQDRPVASSLGWRLRRAAAAAVAVAGLAAAIHFLRPAPALVDRPSGRIRAIAVLPFVNLGAAAEDELLCDGVTEALTAALARTPALRVPSRTAMAGLKGKPVDVAKLAAGHRVEAFVEGSLRREGDRYLLTAQLIDTRDGYHLWAETYDRTAPSAMDFQQEAAGAIAAALAERVSGRLAWRGEGRPEASSEARALHLRAHDLLRQDPRHTSWPRGVPPNFSEAIRLLERTVEIEPDFAAAWSTLAHALLLSSEMDPANRQAALEKAKATARRAIQADPSFAEPHMILGDIALYADWDFSVAETELRRAIELNPRDPYAQSEYADVLRITGRPAQAKVELARALSLAPDDANLRAQNALHLYDERRWSEAMAEAGQALKLRPDYTMALWIKGLCHEAAEDWTAAEREFQAALAIAPEDPRALPALGHLYGVSGRADEAARILARLEALRTGGKAVYYSIALVQTGLGRIDEAVQWLERGLKERDPNLPYASVEQRFGRLRADQRWKELMAKLKLPG